MRMRATEKQTLRHLHWFLTSPKVNTVTAVLLTTRYLVVAKRRRHGLRCQGLIADMEAAARYSLCARLLLKQGIFEQVFSARSKIYRD